MSAEFAASYARELVEKSDELNASNWYLKHKDHVFETIQNAALNKLKTVSFDASMWNYDEYKENYLKSKLESWKYSVVVENKQMMISW
jgi:hypothetical protein